MMNNNKNSVPRARGPVSVYFRQSTERGEKAARGAGDST